MFFWRYFDVLKHFLDFILKQHCFYDYLFFKYSDLKVKRIKFQIVRFIIFVTFGGSYQVFDKK